MDTLTLKELERLEALLEKSEDPGNFPDIGHLFPQRAALTNKLLPALISLARRQLEQDDGSPEGPSSASGGNPPAHADVPPLGEKIGRAIFFKDATGDPCKLMGSPDGGFLDIGMEDSGAVCFRRDGVRSLVAHLQSWLLTGSFSLTDKRTSDRMEGNE